MTQQAAMKKPRHANEKLMIQRMDNVLRQSVKVYEIHIFTDKAQPASFLRPCGLSAGHLIDYVYGTY
jgi:hypothetical protein